MSIADGYAASAGHFDELRGQAAQHATNSGAAYAPLTRAWGEFFAQPEAQTSAALDARFASLQRQIRDNGVTYNVYADKEGPQRPWSLDLFPLLIDAPDWQRIEAGVQQRMRLLEAIMADVYGEQRFLKQGLLPPALVYGHPGYLRPLHGIQPVGGVHLHVAAFDVGRALDGSWWLAAQRCQAPSGLGYLLENRLAVSRQFPQAFASLKVQRLAGTYHALMNSLRRACPAGANAHIALLTPGPYNETYFEHAYLARYLGLSLVQGSDLVVRDERLYLKTLRGLQPVHGLLKRVDDEYLDPLELRADSSLGVPGLLQAIRAGNLLVANAPGSGFLESTALLGFLPALARHALGAELSLPAIHTWWSGECQAAGDERFAYLSDHAEQSSMALSQMPVWHAGMMQVQSQGAMHMQMNLPGQILARSVMLRVFAVSDGLDAQGRPQWRVLPGGLARISGSQTETASMQSGGSSADVWALTEGAIDTTTLLPPQLTATDVEQRQRIVTSRAGESLFWLGRYTERAENTTRLAHLLLESLSGEHQSNAPLLQWLTDMALANSLVPWGTPSALQAQRAFERLLIANVGSESGMASVGYNLRAIKLNASAVRERLSQAHWNAIVRAESELFTRFARLTQQADYGAVDALPILQSTFDALAAITGAQTDRMTRDDGWRLLSIGRHVERLGFLSNAMQRALTAQSLGSEGGFEAMLALFDSTITFRAQYQQSRDIAALLDLLVLDRDNPRSLAWVAHTLRGRLAKLHGSPAGELAPLSLQVPNPSEWKLAALCDITTLQSTLAALNQAAQTVSNTISSTYFTHSGESNRSVGA